MKRIMVILAAALLAVSCNNQDKIQLEQLRADLVALQQSADGVQVPSAIDAVPDIDIDYAFSFDNNFYGVDAGSTVTIEYTLSEDSQVEVTASEGWNVVVTPSGNTGTVTVTAPDPASPVEL